MLPIYRNFMISKIRTIFGDDNIATIIVVVLSVTALILLRPTFGWPTLVVAAAVFLVLIIQNIMSWPRQDPLAVTAWDLTDFLSREQALIVCRYAAKWRRVFFCATAADRGQVEKSVARLYQVCGVAPPSFVWLDSPFQAAVAMMILAHNQETVGMSQVPARFPVSLGDRLLAPGSGDELTLYRAARAEAGNEIERMVALRTLVVENLRRELLANPAGIWNAWSVVYEKIISQAPTLPNDPGQFPQEQGEEANAMPRSWMRLYENTLLQIMNRELARDKFAMGRHSAPEMLEYELAYKWLASTLQTRFPLPPGTETIAEAQACLAKNCGWWIPLEKVVILTEGPSATRIDDNGRLHAEGMAAMEYRDGWAIHAREGALLPTRWGPEAPEKWKLDWIWTTSSQEERRALLEHIDYARLLREDKNAELVHQEGEMGLYVIGHGKDEVDEFRYMQGYEPVMLLQQRHSSTGVVDVQRVPPEMSTCEQARQWILRDGKGKLHFLPET